MAYYAINVRGTDTFATINCGASRLSCPSTVVPLDGGASQLRRTGSDTCDFRPGECSNVAR